MAEKEVGSNRTQQQMKNFVDTINCCGLKEVRFMGPLFTWLYQKEDGSQIRERLDRALDTVEWFHLFPMAKLTHLSSALDYSPLILHLFVKPRKKRMGRVFRFESMWLNDLRCEAIVEEAWDEGLYGGSSDVLNRCLESCRARLEVDICDGCNEEAENSIHFFWKCSCAKELWSSSKLVFPSVMDQLGSFKEMLWCLMMDEKTSLEKIELLLTYAWALWGNRNDVCHGRKQKDGRMLLQWAVQYLEEYRAAVELLPSGQESIQHVQGWIPPPFAKQLGITDIIIEGDSLIVSRGLNHSSSVPVSIDEVIMRIGKASLEFHNVDFSHVKQNANTPAHLLAKYAKGIDN
nr:hypothetical protein CFP56_60800 [Quercus suber]